MKRFLIGLLSGILILVACAPAATESTVPLSPTGTPTIVVATITPAAKTICPKENPSLKFNFDFNDPSSKSTEEILNFLNQGGSPKLVVNAAQTQYSRLHTFFHGVQNIDLTRGGLEKDVTGDDVPELLIAPERYVEIFGCDKGSYHSLFSQTTEAVQEIDIRSIIDANKNGIPEVYIYVNECWGNKCNRLMTFEWQEQDFEYIISDSVFNSQDTEHYCDDINEPFELSFRDIDRDGLEEIILSGELPIWPDDLLFPYRKETRICKWDDHGFVFFRKEFSEPTYRFQALQDADTAAKQEEYKKAFDLYHQTISNENLEWWSMERRYNDFWIFHANYFHDPTPTPNPSLAPDPAEYPSLAAYAYYRIMLIHLVQKNESDARATYGTLQQKFGSDPYAHPYVEMATTFWEAYQSSHKMYDGCAAAIDYAAKHPEILIPLGSDYHGSQSHTYVPADVCPFR